jgi:chromate transporter
VAGSQRRGCVAVAATHHIRFRTALAYWARLGFISFGGPAGQIATMHRDLVETRGWISERRFLHALNYCMLLPGPEAQQLAIYVGWLLHRTWGGICAGLLFLLPSFVLLTALGWAYLRFGQIDWVAGMLYGVKPAVTAIVLHAAYRLGSRTLRNAWLWSVAVCALLALAVLRLPFPLVILAAAATGWLGARVAPDAFNLAGSVLPAAGGVPRPAIIDDDTPAPSHARFGRSGLFRVLAVGAALWLLPMTALLLTVGADHTLTTMAVFFTFAALLTFGGAYAVLPYVYDAAVHQHGWVTAPQMMDGLALGETTPGPLIMIVAFVGFLAGYVEAPFGAEQQWLAGVVAAALVTWFTFLPSFVLILAGAPLVESTRGQLGLTAPLTAITAAVVGVIASLALFFAWHTWWPQGFSGKFDAFAALLTLVAALVLLGSRIGVVAVIGGCAMAGAAAKVFL